MTNSIATITIKPEPASQSLDAMANDEATALAAGLDLNAAKTAKQIDKLKNAGALESHIFICVKWFVTLAFFLIAVSVSVVALHMLLPVTWRWLTSDEITELRNFLFTGSIGAALTAVSQFVFRKSE